MTLNSAVAEGLARDYGIFAQRMRACTEGLSDAEFWTKPYPYGNSIGHLVLHLTGNLNYYIGTQIAGTGYVRNRDLEFTDQSKPRRAETLAALDAAVAMVAATLRAQKDEDWVKPYEAVGADAPTRFAIFLRCGEHFFHHLGQVIYLVKELERRRVQ